MCDVLGLAAFGLDDSCAGGKKVPTSEFLPASVILPRTWRGVILTGETAAASRVETGLMWPPEARISEDTVLRRVPVSLLWSKLVQDGDKLSYWNPSGDTPRCSTAKALHAHLTDLLDRAGWKEQKVVIAIPNTLDEMGQEELLRFFGQRREQVQLVWRPVAAAMQWLHELKSGFRFVPGDWMLVMYMGPDVFETTAFGLQHDKQTGYPVPVRSRERELERLTGMDWAWSCCEGSGGERWQQVLRFPEVWDSLTRQGDNRIQSHPRIWSLKDCSWKIWESGQNLRSWRSALIKAEGSAWLSKQLGRKSIQTGYDWNSFFRALVQKKTEQRRGCLRGVVMCGSLRPRKRPGWFDVQSCAGGMQISRTPALDSIWLPETDILAEGAKLYGERLREGLPTYLDTLPELKIMAQDNWGRRNWKSLVAAATCKGGQVYENTVDGFCYQRRYSGLKVLLVKDQEGQYRQDVVPFPFVPDKDIPIVICVRMKPASGLAQVRLKTLNGSIEDLFFDFSRMEEVTESALPQEELFCPDDGHIKLSDDLLTRDKVTFCAACKDFLQNKSKDSTSLDYYEALRRNWLLPSRPLKVIDENGKTQSKFDPLLQKVASRLEDIGNFIKDVLKDLPKLAKLARQTSFLWRKTPKIFKNFLLEALQSGLPGGMGNKSDIIEAAGRCFYTKEECQLLFHVIVKDDLHFAYALAAAFNVLHYRRNAVDALKEKTAYGLLQIALEMMEAQRIAKKVKFRNAASLIFVLLKYRLQPGHMDFLSENDMSAKTLAVRERLQEYLAELDTEIASGHRLAVQTKRNLEKSRNYLSDILKYIDYKGDPNAVPRWEDEW